MTDTKVFSNDGNDGIGDSQGFLLGA